MRHSHNLPAMPANQRSELGDRKFFDGEPGSEAVLTEDDQSRVRHPEQLWKVIGAMPRCLSFALLGVTLALGASAGLLLARGVASEQSLTFVWMLSEVRSLLVVYAYVLFSALVVFTVLGYVLGRLFDRVHLLSITDPMTGLYNRRHFANRLSEEIMRGRRHGCSTCVLCVDVDRLKAINDGFGHKAGDHAIQAVGRVLSTSVRALDVIARNGGDEFVVLLPETSETQASTLAQRILTEVARHSDALAGNLSVSIGISEVSVTSRVNAEEVLAAADAALYLAKAAGGGRAAFAQAEPDAGHDEHSILKGALLVEGRACAETQR